MQDDSNELPKPSIEKHFIMNEFQLSLLVVRKTNSIMMNASIIRVLLFGSECSERYFTRLLAKDYFLLYLVSRLHRAFIDWRLVFNGIRFTIQE